MVMPVDLCYAFSSCLYGGNPAMNACRLVFVVILTLPTAISAQTAFTNERSDINQDKRVDALDLEILLSDWHKVTGPGVITVDIPGLPESARLMRLVRIPAGTFDMGSLSSERGYQSAESPTHTVTINYDFYIGETEVTQAQWETLMGENPSTRFTGFGIGNDYPVYYVSWNEINETSGFLDRLNALGQSTFRLPSEAEWEYACRAGTRTRFSFGDNLSCDEDCGACSLADQYMVWCGNDNGGLEEVGSRLANDFGLFNMHGNLSEWCEDYWHDNYVGAPTDGDAWNYPTSKLRVVRGGFWYDTARYCRSAVRTRAWAQSVTSFYLGFRVVLPASSISQ
jgi:formylglycine-generating enzyme required for sulfatase activity